MNEFGKQLRYYRKRCTDPERGEALTQEQLGSLLGEKLGDSGYTGAAISEWERGKSQINKDYRMVLIAIIQIFYQYGGIKIPEEADELLLSGNYRSLNTDEREKTFANLDQQDTVKTTNLPKSGTIFQEIIQDLKRWLLEDYLEDSDESPSQWSSTLLKFLGKIFLKWNAEYVLKIIYFAGIWLLTWFFASNILLWPYENQETARTAIIFYAGISIVSPSLIGLLTRTKENKFWLKRNLENNASLRFFTHIGAQMGYQVGYMMIFAISLFGYYLQMARLPSGLIGIGLLWPLILSYTSAREVPYIQWRVYGQLRFKDGIILQIFGLFGPLFGFFFYINYSLLLNPICGIPIFLVSFALAAFWVAKTRG